MYGLLHISYFLEKDILSFLYMICRDMNIYLVHKGSQAIDILEIYINKVER